MARKVIVVAEAGIDAAVALALALLDPNLEVVLVAGVAGIEGPDATNELLHALIEQLDPPRLPRYGAALPRPSSGEACTQQKLGLSRTKLRACGLHHPRAADKLIAETIRQHPGELSILTLGPLTTLALALDRDRELPRMIKSVIIVGGAGHGPGNAGAVSEFHFCCDPAAARQLFQIPTPKTVLPLETTQSTLFAPAELNRLAVGESPACKVLGQILPVGIHDLAQEQGLEGMYLADVFGVACVANPGWFKARPITADVETTGELTRGMVVIDNRRQRKEPNVDWVHEADVDAVRSYLFDTICGGSVRP
jgi:inosine-uridine nucleoside N-ribohydrolase